MSALLEPKRSLELSDFLSSLPASLFLWLTNKYLGSRAWVSAPLSGALQRNQRKEIQSKYQRLPILFDV